MAICMSSMTVKQLVKDGLDRDKLCYVLPALDSGLEPRRIIIGLTTKLYPDGRKREALLVRLALEMDLSAFHFEIYGAGWESVTPVLEKAGALVRASDDRRDTVCGDRDGRQRGHGAGLQAHEREDPAF